MNKQLRSLNRDISENLAILNDPHSTQGEKQQAQLELDHNVSERGELYAQEDARSVDRNKRKEVIQGKRKAAVDDEKSRTEEMARHTAKVRSTSRYWVLIAVGILSTTQACFAKDVTKDTPASYKCPTEGCLASQEAIDGALAAASNMLHLPFETWDKGYTIVNFVNTFVGDDEIQVLAGNDGVYTVGNRKCPFATADGNTSLLHAYLHALTLLHTGYLDMQHTDKFWADEKAWNDTLIETYCEAAKP